jgi:hypothetical protein
MSSLELHTASPKDILSIRVQVPTGFTDRVSREGTALRPIHCTAGGHKYCGTPDCSTVCMGTLCVPYITDMHGMEHQQHLANVTMGACVVMFLDLGFMNPLSQSILCPTHKHGWAHNAQCRHWLLAGSTCTQVCDGLLSHATGESRPRTPDMSVPGLLTTCLHMLSHYMMYVRQLTRHLLRELSREWIL